MTGCYPHLWVGITAVFFPRELQQNVFNMVDVQGRTVGYPSELEARKYLVQAEGDLDHASHTVHKYRHGKVSHSCHNF